MDYPLALFWNIGAPELLVFAVVLLLLFGHRLPSVMRSLGRGIVEFKRGVQGVEDEVDSAGKAISSDAKRNDI